MEDEERVALMVSALVEAKNIEHSKIKASVESGLAERIQRILYPVLPSDGGEDEY